MQCELIIVVSIIGSLGGGVGPLAICGNKDPQIVVIDEVAGQLISYFGLATPKTFALNWKYLLLGFILFRVFDIWKPFPARQAESLPGGLGIMADDWIAGIYAALGLVDCASDWPLDFKFEDFKFETCGPEEAGGNWNLQIGIS